MILILKKEKMLVEIRNKIKEKLQNIVGVGSVEDNFDVRLRSYPAILFEPYVGEDQITTTTQNKKRWGWRVLVVNEYETQNKTEAIEKILEIIENIIDEIDGDFTLGGLVLKTEIRQGDFGTIETETGKTIYGSIILYTEWM